MFYLNIRRRIIMKINLFDFDGTIYDGDSTFDFIIYEIKRHPIILITLFEKSTLSLAFLSKMQKQPTFLFLPRHPRKWA